MEQARGQAIKKVEPDYAYDQKALVSKQKKLKLILQKCILDKNIEQLALKHRDFQAVKHKGELYAVGEYIELWDITLKKPYVGRLCRIVQAPSHLERLPFIEIEWYLRKQDLPGQILTIFGKHMSVAEVFPSKIKYCLYVQGIKRKCVVLSSEEYGKMTTTYDFYYFTRSNYDYKKEELIPSPLSWKRTCYCDAPENPDLQYVMCEKCEKWFHVECVPDLREEDTFFCTRCNRIVLDCSASSL